MSEKPKPSDCLYFFEGKCKARSDFETINSNDCKSETKDRCCYTCSLSGQCESRCDLLNTKEEKITHPPSPRLIGLTKEERLEFGSHVLWRVYMAMGSLLIVTGLLLIPALAGSNYPLQIESHWRLYIILGTNQAFSIFLFILTPLLLILTGFVLTLYGAVRLKSSRNENPKP